MCKLGNGYDVIKCRTGPVALVSLHIPHTFCVYTLSELGSNQISDFGLFGVNIVDGLLMPGRNKFFHNYVFSHGNSKGNMKPAKVLFIML